MKQLHKPNLWSWSLFNEERNLDFHSVFWGRPAGNVVIDPLPLSEHDAAHVARLGGVQDIILTNSDHARAATELQEQLQRLGNHIAGGAAAGRARIWGPALEPAFLAALNAQPLRTEHELGAELEVIELQGSKTPGELCLLLEGDTLVTGDLIRGQRAGRLNLLPDAKLADRVQAVRSLERLAQRQQIEAVLVGDGWPAFRGGAALLNELLNDLRSVS
ncbi:MAG: hypothetical protein RL685_4363 [Pseudomonadota bacterium]|jgi:hypothetical protein